MKMINTRYRKNGKYASRDYGMALGWLILLIAMLIASAYMNNQSKGLVSPLVIGPVRQAMAKEPEVKISCEDPRGYLLCKAYSKEITWEQYDKLNKIFECESHYNPNATNVNIHKDGSKSIDRGIGQVNDRYHKKLSNQDAFDFKKNIDYSVSLFKRSGAGQWSCARILNIK